LNIINVKKGIINGSNKCPIMFYYFQNSCGVKCTEAHSVRVTFNTSPEFPWSIDACYFFGRWVNSSFKSRKSACCFRFSFTKTGLKLKMVDFAKNMYFQALNYFNPVVLPLSWILVTYYRAPSQNPEWILNAREILNLALQYKDTSIASFHHSS